MAEDPDLFSELAGDQGRSSTACSWASWLATRDDADQWRAAIADRRYTVAPVLRAPDKREVDLSRSTLERHRNARCKQCRS